MKRVIGIGGIFFKANDPEKLGAWYKKHLGLDVQEWGGATFKRALGPISNRNDNPILFGRRLRRAPITSRRAKNRS